MLNYLKSLSFVLFVVLLWACSDSVTDEGGEQGNDPVVPPANKEEKVEKPRYIWVDAAANFADFATKDNIRRDLALAKDAGFTDIVVDVRSTSGDVLFKTDKINQVEYLWAWTNAGQVKVYRNADWDYLQAFIDYGHELGLRIHAGFNTFCGGVYVQGQGSGILFRDKENARNMATTLNTANGLVNTMDLDSEAEKFLNPSSAEVQNLICGLLADLAKYDIDGIVLDRGRFQDLRADFSEQSRKQFAAYVSDGGFKWPDDIIAPGAKTYPSPATKYIKQWLEFRAKTIYEFMAKARNAVKDVNPKVKFGVYVGAWYGSYYEVGVNWASKNFDTSSYAWSTPNYKNFGYAELMDHMLLGAYASPLSVYGTTEWTIQGFCQLGKRKTGNACPLVVGGPDVGNWNLTGVSQLQELQAVEYSVSAAMNGCDGYFLFDMVHLKMNPKKWDYVKRGINSYLNTLKK